MPNFCGSSSMQNINHSVAVAAFLQDVWLDWLRHLQEHNAAQQRAFTHRTKLWQKKDWKYLIAIWTSQNIQIVILLRLIKILVIKTKESDHSLYLKGASCEEIERLRGCSKISAPCWQRLITAWKKRRDSGSLQIFAQKKPASLTFERHPPASFTRLLHLTEKSSNQQSYSALTE